MPQAEERVGVRKIPNGDRTAAREFVRLERRLNADRPLYVPQAEPDVVKRLTGRSALSAGVENALFIGGDVTCCAAFVNHRYQEHHREAVGFIGHFAVAERASQAAVAATLAEAEIWLADRGVTRVVAPYNGSFLAGLGMRTAEFDSGPLFPFQWHPPFYAGLLEACGYRATRPWWSYRIDFSNETYRAASHRALAHPRCRVRPVDKRRWREELETWTAIFNDTFRDEWEYHPVTIDETLELLGPLKPIIDAQQMLFAEIDGEVVGTCLGAPDWNPAARPLNGRAGPAAKLRFLIGARRSQDAGLLVIGVTERHRGKHIGQTLASTLYKRYEDLGLRSAEYHIVNDSNIASRTLASSLGGQGRILYHNYAKVLP